LSTFYANAIAAGHHGSGPVACVVTDSHVHRVWAPRRPASSRIVYFVPVDGTAACLADYGVHPDHVRVTGFPLPSELVGIGQEALRRHFLARLGRLRRMTRSRAVTSSDPLTITVAVGGAGAQVHHIRSLLTELRHELKTGAIRLVLVAGTHEWAARMFRGWVSREVEKGLPPDAVAILVEATFTDYYRAFNRQLAHTDILWTKPSELVFYAGLGLPLVLEEPVGAHEEHNGELIITAGAGVRRPPAGQLAPWLRHMMDSGHFIRAAEAGRDRFSANGTTRIASYCSTDLYNEFTRG
jgi:hypothetical protein